jgi:hypothetical protein
MHRQLTLSRKLKVDDTKDALLDLAKERRASNQHLTTIEMNVDHWMKNIDVCRV